MYWIEIKGKVGESLLIQNVVEGAKNKQLRVSPTQIEPDVIYPILRGRDISRWCSHPSLHMIVTHPPSTPKKPYEESELRTTFPNTYIYLAQFKESLKKRVRVRKLAMEWYALGEIGPYTFAPNKVMWGEVSNDIAAAVVSAAHSTHLEQRVVIPDHTVITVSFEEPNEAHFVAALLNSAPARLVVKGYIVLHPSPHVLEHVGLRKFDEQSQIHRRLSEAGKRAHELAAKIADDAEDKSAKGELAEVEDQIDHAAAELWGITEAELQEIRKALEIL